jgi:SAM-dependent methyltransferase
MLRTLKPVSAAPALCKICSGVAQLYGVIDFHKGHDRLPLSGIPIYYRRCAACDFLFTDAFDCWSDEQFKTHVYNDDYLEFDPDYKGPRPLSNADVVARLWAKHKAETRVLDFGGGNDLFCERLRSYGFPVAVTYDPMVPTHALRPDGKFDLVTCFETLEHVPNPLATVALIVECVAEPGLILYSTVIQPPDFSNQGLAWWYVAPRNGHISLFSKRALSVLWGRHGYKTFSFNDNIHLAFRTLPAFLAHLQGRADDLWVKDHPVQVGSCATNGAAMPAQSPA